MISITGIFSKLRRSPHLAAVSDFPPILAGATLAQDYPQLPIMVNLATCFILWWRAKNRVVYRLAPDTADWLRTVNLTFIPETPPTGWTNNTIIIESLDKSSMVNGAWSIATYHLPDLQGQPRYYFCYLIGEDAYSFSIYANLGDLNARLIDAGRFLAADILQESGGRFFVEPLPAEQQQHLLDIVKFVFAASYFSTMPRERLAVTRQDGPPARNDRGKVIKNRGKIIPQWTYQNLRYVPSPLGEPRGPLDKTDLTLEPVIVRPYLRRTKTGKVVFVESHDSHRWKAPERVGKKIVL